MGESSSGLSEAARSEYHQVVACLRWRWLHAHRGMGLRQQGSDVACETVAIATAVFPEVEGCTDRGVESQRAQTLISERDIAERYDASMLASTERECVIASVKRPNYLIGGVLGGGRALSRRDYFLCTSICL